MARSKYWFITPEDSDHYVPTLDEQEMAGMFDSRMDKTQREYVRSRPTPERRRTARKAVAKVQKQR